MVMIMPRRSGPRPGHDPRGGVNAAARRDWALRGRVGPAPRGADAPAATPAVAPAPADAPAPAAAPEPAAAPGGSWANYAPSSQWSWGSGSWQGPQGWGGAGAPGV